MARLPGEERDRFYCKYCGFPCKEGREPVGTYGIGGWNFADTNLDLTLGDKQDLDGFLTVAETSITATAMPRNSKVYVAYDCGRNFFDVDSKDYEFKFTLYLTSCDVLGWGGILGLSNHVDDAKAIIDAASDLLECHLYRTAGGTYRIYVVEIDSGVQTASDSLDISAATTYYGTGTIDASAATFTAELFTDSARATSAGSASISITSTQTYRYFMPVYSYNDNTAPDLTYSISSYQIPSCLWTGVKESAGSGCPFCGSKNWR